MGLLEMWLQFSSENSSKTRESVYVKKFQNSYIQKLILLLFMQGPSFVPFQQYFHLFHSIPVPVQNSESLPTMIILDILLENVYSGRRV